MIATGHHGSVRFSERIGCFTFTETVYEGVRQIPDHMHANAAFCFVLAGSYRERIDTTTLGVAPRRILFRPAAASHVDTMEATRVRCFIAEAPPEWFSTLMANEVSVPVVLDDPRVHDIGRRIRHEVGWPDDLTKLSVEALMSELAVACTRRKAGRADSELVARAVELLDDRFREKISLHDVAMAIGVPRSTLATEFRRVRGCSVGDYVRKRRVAFAEDLMRDANVPLADVALSAGFAHQSHFCRVFKRLVGMTPAAYRRRR